MKITHSELTAKLAKAAEQLVSPEAAQYLAEETIEAYLRKAPRTNPLKATIGDIEATIKNKDKEMAYKVDLPSFVSIDFQHHGPLVYLKQIHNMLEERANQNGLVMAAFTNSQSMHTLHSWVQGLAKRGLLAIAVCNGGPGAVVPFNGTKGVFGTNPMAYGIPGENGEIFCVDMATSEIPYFEIMDANKNKESLREHSAVDSTGEFTTDASEALDFSKSSTDPVSNIVPMGGGYKGYNIVYLMEVLTSALIAMPSSPEMSNDFVPEEHGSILLVFSPKAMGSEEAFKSTIKTLHEAVKAQEAKQGETIRIPGEENSRRFAELKDAEIEIDDGLMEKLDKLVGN